MAEPRPAPSRPWRWTRRLVIVALAVATVVVAGQWVLHRSYFSVRVVTVQFASGAGHESRAALVTASGLNRHPPMIDVNTSRIERRLERFAWVERAVVVTHWPHSVTITVTDRTAVAVARDAHGHLELVDDTGRRLGASGPTGAYPLLVAEGRRAGETWPFTHWARPAALVASRLPKAFADQVAEVRVTRAGDVTLALTTPVTFDLGEVTQLHQKFVAVASVIAHPLLLHAGDRVDVSVPSTPTVSGP